MDTNKVIFIVYWSYFIAIRVTIIIIIIIIVGNVPIVNFIVITIFCT
jgi:hypothetical protein